MSLLLDALKKSGHSQNGEAGGASSQPAASRPGLELSLEEPRSAPSPQPVLSKSEPARDAGKNLFAAKSKPVSRKGNMKLGIIPIALISGLVIAGIGGLYVWYQIQPHPVARRPVMPSQPAIVASPPKPVVPAVEAPPPAQVAQVQTPQPIARKSTLLPRMPRKAGETMHIEKQQEVDGITPLLQTAYQAYRMGDFTTAQKDYAAVLQQDGKNRDALLGMAAIAQQQGQDATAAQYYGQLLALDPRDPLAYAGMSALGKDGTSGKESRLKLLLEQQPQAAALHFALGNLYAEQSRWAEAQQAYFSAYSLQPDAAQFSYNLAISLDHLGQGKLAVQYYQRALQLENSGNANFDHTQAEQRLKELKAP